jgi:hypothetical protein
MSAVAVIAALVAACSGGAGTGSAPVSPAGSSSASVTTSTTVVTTLPAITGNGYSFAGSLATTSTGVVLSEAIAANPPSGIPALFEARTVQNRQIAVATPTPTPTPINYVTLSVPITIEIAPGTAISWTLPQITAGVSYMLAVNNGSGWTSAIAGPATINGTTVTFSALPTFTLTAGTPTILALYSIITVPPPTPSPVPTPVVSPASITFSIGASPTPASVSVVESNYTGNFTSAINCTASPSPSPVPTTNPFVAQVSPATGLATFAVTSGKETGTCSASFTDANNATVSIPVTVGP